MPLLILKAFICAHAHNGYYNVSVLMVTISASVIFAKIEPAVLQLQAAGFLKLLLCAYTHTCVCLCVYLCVHPQATYYKLHTNM